ncbi:hypothetical protein [Neomoorella mulderi]|uniref:Uncharacterized protein n=1 Tax=Moorella mulderi DSM 14980 TaxID=1122241 RepID=A0A151ASQ7_9FIRM|nr:hypothetical protein [Moorella mulderi]KYH30622.1 hypothetical protein MOMUL_30100 [Moorella mulderi DSM 14980]
MASDLILSDPEPAIQQGKAVIGKNHRVRYVNRDKSHPLYGQTGIIQARARGPGPRNLLVKLDDGNLVVAPWGNWRVAGGNSDV